MNAQPWWEWHGYAWYVWGSYGAVAVAVAFEIWQLRGARKLDREQRR